MYGTEVEPVNIRGFIKALGAGKIKGKNFKG